MRVQDRADRAPLSSVTRYQVFTRNTIQNHPRMAGFPEAELNALRAVSAVLPFRVNNYVLDELIDWTSVPHDPIYQLTFPQAEMLEPEQYGRMLNLVESGAAPSAIHDAARAIQLELNPHPAEQTELNVPLVGGEPLAGVQHKYRETVLFFPAAGQTCHAYCAYCFRWPQFVGLEDIKFASRQVKGLSHYLRTHREVSSVLLTGGDPLIMRSRVLRRYVEPLLDSSLEHVTSIRIGTKAPAYWPQRFVTDDDADDLLRLFEQVRTAGKTLALMAHFSHPRELQTPIAIEAVRRIQDAGAVIRTQAPLIRHVNDNGDTWAELWKLQVRHGLVPYYMFVERDTGPRGYFEVPLVRALGIFNDAYRQVSGLGRTVRGPSMSTSPGKILIDGTASINGENVFALKLLQGRDPRWAGRVFFAGLDPEATWLDDLRPAFGESEFFFEEPMRALRVARRTSSVREPGLRQPLGTPTF